MRKFFVTGVKTLCGLCCLLIVAYGTILSVGFIAATFYSTLPVWKRLIVVLLALAFAAGLWGFPILYWKRGDRMRRLFLVTWIAQLFFSASWMVLTFRKQGAVFEYLRIHLELEPPIAHER